MASSKQFRDYILEQLRELQNITYKPMMGEYILYFNNVIWGGIYDDRLLIKKTILNKKFSLKEVIPYPSAKPMYLVENIDDAEYIRNLITITHEGLILKK